MARPPPPATPRPASRPASHPKPSRRCRTTPPHIPTPRPSANPPGGQPTEAAALQLWRPDYQTAQCTTLCPARPQRAPCVQASVKQPYRSFKERDTDDSAQRAPAHRRAAAPRPLSYPRHAPPPPPPEIERDTDDSAQRAHAHRRICQQILCVRARKPRRPAIQPARSPAGHPTKGDSKKQGPDPAPNHNPATAREAIGRRAELETCYPTTPSTLLRSTITVQQPPPYPPSRTATSAATRDTSHTRPVTLPHYSAIRPARNPMDQVTSRHTPCPTVAI
jgi:hypothetical protein